MQSDKLVGSDEIVPLKKTLKYVCIFITLELFVSFCFEVYGKGNVAQKCTKFLICYCIHWLDRSQTSAKTHSIMVSINHLITVLNFQIGLWINVSLHQQLK